MTPDRFATFKPSGEGSPVAHDPWAFAELWISLAALLSSYTAAHGLNAKHQAAVKLDENRITVRHGRKWLRLKRNGAAVTWTRENGKSETLELTEHGRLRGPAGEQELDMAAEAWARELMQDKLPDQIREQIRAELEH